jgi:C4-dicarboxylate-binding protein DctP
MRAFLAILVVVALVFMATPDARADSPILIKYNHVVPEATPKGKAAARFAELVEKRLGGRVKVQVFPNAQLYDEDAAFQALLMGDLQITAPTLAKCYRYTKTLQVFDLPFLFNDIDAVDCFQNSAAGKKLLDSMVDKGFKGLSFGREGMKYLNCKKPLRRPEDARGLKFRIMPSDVLAAQFEAVGAVPQKLAFSEVYNALQTGVIDGHENTWSLIYTKKFYEVCKYFTVSDHGVLDYIIITNAKFWNGLPKDIRVELEAIMAEVMKEEYKLAAEQTEADLKAIKAAGKNEFIELTPDEKAAWRKAMLPVWKKFEPEIGKDLIDAAAACNKKN